MNAEERLKELFAQALERKTPVEREEFLAEACNDQPGLRPQVESLLRAHEQAGDFLGQTIKLPPADLESEPPGTMIGRYKLLEKIGEGGFGVVYMAEQQEPVQRKVALKIIKAGMDTREVIARFEAERQALALMDHPNIAKVLDGGMTETKRPYFVMELVRGIAITDYCDLNNLATTERLQLFIKTCHAVQHAHQKAVIHRDLKPSNILVTLHDGEPVPKVIDFGVAKALGQKLTERTLFTAFRQMIGTPAYMAPEQAEMSGVDIDTRADIYSLGVLLYELLTGVTPFDREALAKAALDEVRRIIRETEPPRPSVRLRTLGEKLPEVARQRRTEPSALSRVVDGDLDWITMKCLEKDRTRRYETVSGLGLDVRRYLDNEPVSAAAPGAMYRLGKFVRRHRATLGAATAIATLLLAGVAASIWQTVRASRAERVALLERNRSWQVAVFLQEMLEGVRPSIALGRDTALLRETVDQASARVNNELQAQPEVQATLREVIGRIYSELGEYPKAEAMFRQVVALEKQVHGPEHRAVAESLHNLGSILEQENRLVEAERILRDVLAMRKRLLGDRHVEVAQTLNNLAGVLQIQGKLPEAEQMQQSALDIRKQLLGEEHPEVAQSLDGLAVVLGEQGKLLESEALQRDALAMQRRLLGKEHPDVAVCLYHLAVVLEKEGKLTESESLHREALAMRQKLLGHQHDDVADSLNGLAMVLQAQHRPDEAEKLFRDALAVHRKRLGGAHLKIAISLHNLAMMLEQRGKLAEAEALCREALAMKKLLLGDKHSSVADTLDNLGVVLREQQNVTEAETMHRQAVAMRQKLAGQQDGRVADSLSNLAEDLHAQGRLEEAEAAYRQVLVLQRRCFGDSHLKIAHTLNNLGTVVADRHNPKEAIALYGDSLAMEKRLSGAQNPDLAFALNNLARVQRDQGNLHEAEALYREAWAVRKSLPDRADLLIADSISSLAGIFVGQHNFEEAEPLARECLAIQTEALGEEHPQVIGSLHNLMVLLIERHKEAEYLDVRTELTLARVGLARGKRQRLGLDKSIALVSTSIESGDIVPDESLSTYLGARASLLGERGRWRDAINDLLQARRLMPSYLPNLGLGLMLVETGDLEGYKDFRRRLLVRFMGAQDPQTAAEAAVGMLLQPGGTGVSIASELAELAVSQETNDFRGPFFQLAKALAEYRQGSFSSAESRARQSLAHSGTNHTTAVAAGALLAMAQHQLNQVETARTTFREAVELAQTKLRKLEGGDLGENWPEWLLARLVLREGNGLIENETNSR